MWNCHSWPLDVCSNVNHLTVLNGLSLHTFISQSVICSNWQCYMGVHHLTVLNRLSLQTFISQSVICCKWQFQMVGTLAAEGLSAKYELILGLTLASQRSFLWKTNETLRTGLIFLRWSIWGVTCLGLLSKWMFSHLSPWKPHKCVLKPSEQGSIFRDNRFEGLHA